MSPRHPGHDEQGRPIVAELGRAETPHETAVRKAEASRKRRTNLTALNLGIATVASMLVAILIVAAVGLLDSGSRIEPVDYVAESAAAQDSVDAPLVVPALPEGWVANRAELVTGSDGVVSWQIGFVTPAEDYLAVIQGIDANPSWLDAHVRGAPVAGTIELGGVTWSIHDRRDADDPGNVAYALTTTTESSTIVLAGTADDAEFEELARAVAKELTA